MILIPANSDPRRIEKMLNKMFSPEWLRTTATEVGYVQRNRKIDPVILLKALNPTANSGFSGVEYLGYLRHTEVPVRQKDHMRSLRRPTDLMTSHVLQLPYLIIG